MKRIDKSKPWYWLCHSDKKNSIGYNCTEATRSKFRANLIIYFRNKKEESGIWWIRKKYEHPDQDFKQYQCPKCKNLMSDKELDDTWDWAGPHCNKCGCTGLVMFASVQEHAPVMNRGSVIGEAKKLIQLLKRGL